MVVKKKQREIKPGAECQVKGCEKLATDALISSIWEKGKKKEDFGIPVCHEHYELGQKEGLNLK